MGAALAFGLALGTLLFAQPSKSPEESFQQAVKDFENGNLDEAARGFDDVAERRPELAPQLWQRGIALYYVGRYQDCREQFESHRTVNPNDVENAAWHFLCVARGESLAAANEALLPVGPDARVPMREIYDMFRGVLVPERVLAEAGDAPSAQFYAHLYLGLYYEARGEGDAARKHIALAAAERFARHGGYMHMVARVHLGFIDR